MKLVVGIGNPGEKYRDNRHNVGHFVVDSLQSTVDGENSWKELKKFRAVVCRLNAVDVLLAKPTTFMNNSGVAVKKLLDYYSSNNLLPTDLYVIHDDLDILLGKYKIQFGKGPKDHNGLISIDKALGTNEYWHIRVGIDPTSRGATRGEEIVLSDFTAEEKGVFDNTIKKLLIDLINLISKQ